MSNKLLKKHYNGHCLYRVIPDPRYLTLLTNGYGTLLADALSGYSGSVVHLTATPDDDCHFIDYDSTACEIVDDDLTFSNSDCTAQANFGRNVHNVTTLTSNYGSISVNKNTGYSGDIFTLSNTPNADCTFGSYSITGATLTSNQFMIEKEDVSAQGSFNRNVHNVTLQNDGHGNIGANKTTGYSGDIITLSNTPNQGYSLSGYSITGATLTSNQFKIGTGNVTAKAWFNSVSSLYYKSNASTAIQPNKSLTLNLNKNITAHRYVNLNFTYNAPNIYYAGGSRKAYFVPWYYNISSINWTNGKDQNRFWCRSVGSSSANHIFYSANAAKPVKYYYDRYSNLGTYYLDSGSYYDRDFSANHTYKLVIDRSANNVKKAVSAYYDNNYLGCTDWTTANTITNIVYSAASTVTNNPFNLLNINLAGFRDYTAATAYNG